MSPTNFWMIIGIWTERNLKNEQKNWKNQATGFLTQSSPQFHPSFQFSIEITPSNSRRYGWCLRSTYKSSRPCKDNESRWKATWTFPWPTHCQKGIWILFQAFINSHFLRNNENKDLVDCCFIWYNATCKTSMKLIGSQLQLHQM